VPPIRNSMSTYLPRNTGWVKHCATSGTLPKKPDGPWNRHPPSLAAGPFICAPRVWLAAIALPGARRRVSLFGALLDVELVVRWSRGMLRRGVSDIEGLRRTRPIDR